MVMLVVVLVTTSDQLLDHKRSVGVPRLSSYIWVSKGVLFRVGHFGGYDGDH